MNLSPRKNVSPFRKPQVSFVYQNSPIKSKVSGKENVNLSAFVRPPPSPRVVKKNITVQAQKGIKQNINFANREVCCKCGKISGQNKGNNLCQQCRMQQMVKVKQPRQTFSPKGFKIASSNCLVSQSVYSNSVVKQPQRILQTHELLKELEQEKQALIRQNEKSIENDIKITYKNKKVQLKAHYQRIKAAIKKSIEKDLKVLEEEQKGEIEKIQDNRQRLQQNIQNIEQIERHIKQRNTQTLNEYEYSQIMNKKKIKENQILQSHEYSRTKTSEFGDIKEDIIFLYDLNTYRMVQRSHDLVKHSSGNGVLFSFQGKN